MPFDIIIMILRSGRTFCSKFDFLVFFLILANFAAFLDYTKKHAEVGDKNG